MNIWHFLGLGLLLACAVAVVGVLHHDCAAVMPLATGIVGGVFGLATASTRAPAHHGPPTGPEPALTAPQA